MSFPRIQALGCWHHFFRLPGLTITDRVLTSTSNHYRRSSTKCLSPWLTKLLLTGDFSFTFQLSQQKLNKRLQFCNFKSSIKYFFIGNSYFEEYSSQMKRQGSSFGNVTPASALTHLVHVLTHSGRKRPEFRWCKQDAVHFTSVFEFSFTHFQILS